MKRIAKGNGELLWGSDPEFFASKTIRGVKCVIPPIFLRTDYGLAFEENGRHPIFKRYGETIVHEDGCAFEMSTPPSNNWREMWSVLNEVKDAFGKDILSQYSGICDPILYSLPAMKYQVDRWKNRGDEFMMATTFGCDPDMDVYSMEAKCQIIDASTHEQRYGGGHIHVSGIPEIKASPLIAIRSMVITAGVASTAYTDVPSLEKKRLFLYGRPGKFRIQDYGKLYKGLPYTDIGVEYRTPSNTWTKDLSIAEKIFEWAEIGMKNLLRGGLFTELASVVEKDAIDCILKVDQKKAHEILDFMKTKI